MSRKTAGKITSILPDGDYSQTLAILVNAVYFNATWTKPFDPKSTADAPFTLADGSHVNVKMMHGEGSFGYLKRRPLPGPPAALRDGPASCSFPALTRLQPGQPARDRRLDMWTGGSPGQFFSKV